MIHERDRHTDRQTEGQTPYDGIGRTYAQHRAAKTFSPSGSHIVLVFPYQTLRQYSDGDLLMGAPNAGV